MCALPLSDARCSPSLRQSLIPFVPCMSPARAHALQLKTSRGASLLIEKLLDPASTKFTLDEIQERKKMGPLRSGLDYVRLEACIPGAVAALTRPAQDYLDDSNFIACMGMGRAVRCTGCDVLADARQEFAKLPKWKRDQKKTEKGLF